MKLREKAQILLNEALAKRDLPPIEGDAQYAYTRLITFYGENSIVGGVYACLEITAKQVKVSLYAVAKHEAPLKENACWFGKMTTEILDGFVTRYLEYIRMVDVVRSDLTNLEQQVPTICDTTSNRQY